MGRISYGADPPISPGELGRLIMEWAVIAASVVNGYEFGIEEYENDISVRDDIERALMAEPSLPDDLARALKEADDRVRPLLVRTRQPVYGDAPPSWYWHHGIPRNARGPLLEDARLLGLL